MPRDFPTPYVGRLHRWVEGARGPDNEPLDTWAPAKDEPGIPFQFVQVTPVDERDVETGRPYSLEELYIPPQLRTTDDDGKWTVDIDDPAPNDVIDIFGVEYEVQGLVRDYTKGFHGWQAGKVVNVQRA